MSVRPPEPVPGPGLPDWLGSAEGQAYSPEEPWWEPPEHEPSDAELHGAWPDPFAGPPDFETWRISQEEADAEATLDEGALDGDFPAASFADGGPAEAMAPDAVLAALSQDAMDAGLDWLTDDELIGLLQTARRLASWQAGIELAAVAELDTRRQAQAARPGWSRVSEHISAELAAALTLTGRSADELLSLTREVERMPGVRSALLAGRIDRAKAAVFATELAKLSDLAAAAIAAAFAGIAGSMTTGQLRAALRAMVLEIDPDAVRRRAKAGRAEARVERWQEGSGNAALAGRELPPAEVIAADARLTAIAKALQSAGAPGTLDQLRAAAYTALLTGRDPETLIPTRLPDDHADPADPGPADPGQAPRQPTRADRSTSSAGHPSNDLADTRADRGTDGSEPRASRAAAPPPGSLAALAGSVHLTTPLSAWLGLTDAPGEVTGYGPIDADTCRVLAARLAAGPSTHWCVTFTSTDGRALAHACARHGPPGSPGPSPARGTPEPPGPPTLAEPSGPPVPAEPPGPPVLAEPPGLPAPTEPPGSAGHADRDRLATVANWLAMLPVAWLESGTCGHPRQTAGYRPSPLLAHLNTIRQRTCAFPGCRRPARRCDQDHTVPYDQGGRTCECNLAPLCRQHHRAKQAPGWRLAQPQPGVLVWSPPHGGRTYTVTPQPYPI